MPQENQDFSLNLLLKQENDYVDNEEEKYHNLSQYVSRVRQNTQTSS